MVEFLLDFAFEFAGEILGLFLDEAVEKRRARKRKAVGEKRIERKYTRLK